MVLTQMTSLAIFSKEEETVEVSCGERDPKHSSERKAILDLCKTHSAQQDNAYEHFYHSFPFFLKAVEIMNGTGKDIHQYS